MPQLELSEGAWAVPAPDSPIGSKPPALPPLPQRQPPPQPGPSTGLLLHQVVAIVGATAQTTITITQWHASSSSAGRMQTAGLSAALVAMACGMLLSPGFYWRHQAWLLPVGRILIHLMPCMRRSRVSLLVWLAQRQLGPPLPSLGRMLHSGLAVLRLTSGQRVCVRRCLGREAQVEERR